MEIGIWLPPLRRVEAGDGAGDGGDGVGEPASSSDIAVDLLYMLHNLQFNSGDVRYSCFVDRDRCSWVGMAVMVLEIPLHQAT
jgi:hypothetical protein